MTIVQKYANPKEIPDFYPFWGLLVLGGPNELPPPRPEDTSKTRAFARSLGDLLARVAYLGDKSLTPSAKLRPLERHHTSIQNSNDT